MNMDIIQSAAFEMLVNVALAVLALAGAYAVTTSGSAHPS